MSKVKCVYSTVSERDMDMIFLQLFTVDDSFTRLFLDKASIGIDCFSVESVELSKSDPQLGESDITVILSSEGKKTALLIEDKIDAAAMPRQPERYIERGKEGVARGEYDSFTCFIVCPQKYYDNNEESHKYPNILTYEEIKCYLDQKDSHLYSAYSQQIDQSIEKAKRPPQVTLNEQANAFFKQYKDYQECYYPTLDLRTSRKSNGYWAQYATRLGNVYLLHKIQEGKVDLTFSNASKRMSELEHIADWFRMQNVINAKAVVTGKAGAIRIDVPKLDMSKSFDQCDVRDVIKCFDAISRIIETTNIIASANELSNL